MHEWLDITKSLQRTLHAGKPLSSSQRFVFQSGSSHFSTKLAPVLILDLPLGGVLIRCTTDNFEVFSLWHWDYRRNENCLHWVICWNNKLQIPPCYRQLKIWNLENFANMLSKIWTHTEVHKGPLDLISHVSDKMPNSSWRWRNDQTLENSLDLTWISMTLWADGRLSPSHTIR